MRRYVKTRETTMIRYSSLILVAALGSACALAQENPYSTELKQVYNGIKNNLMKAAEKMPEDKYGFKASPDVRPFGQLIAHIADSQTRGCAGVKGEQKTPGAA